MYNSYSSELGNIPSGCSYSDTDSDNNKVAIYCILFGFKYIFSSNI